ncbi:MAG: hypothetical protein LBR90_01390 [Elusimicrobiota bacterium]|jgi:hypothetical protein|nr:hypothetical protein [Elusimicrobiota bacterium]
MSVFEAGMLICFGISWPFAIWRVWRAKNVKGVSIIFSGLVFLGYISGMLHKYFYSMDWVFLLYFYNAALVFTHMVLYFIYSRRARAC